MPLTFYKKPALVVYVTCGDPGLETTREIVLAAIDAGADVIEGNGVVAFDEAAAPAGVRWERSEGIGDSGFSGEEVEVGAVGVEVGVEFLCDEEE